MRATSCSNITKYSSLYQVLLALLHAVALALRTERRKDFVICLIVTSWMKCSLNGVKNMCHDCIFWKYGP